MELPTYIKLLMHKCLQNKTYIEQVIRMKLNYLLNSEISL